MTPTPTGWSTGRWLGGLSLIVGVPLLPLHLEGVGHRVYPTNTEEGVVLFFGVLATLTAIGSLFHLLSTLRGVRDVPLFLLLLVYLFAATPLVGLNVLKAWFDRNAPTHLDDT